jgi:aminopeptidase YwaD
MKKPFKTIFTYFAILFVLIFSQYTYSQQVPLGQENLVALLNEELSGESAKRNVEYISRLHRMRGSEGYNEATAFIQTKLEEYQLESIELIKIPTDGKTMYGTQKSRLAWDVEFAELWEVKNKNGNWIHKTKVADWQSVPLVVAQDSESGEVTAALVDIGAGISENEYANKEIQGKLVLTSSQPENVVPLAIEKYGAVGIISYAQNQVTAWWKENENLIRWGHLDTFAKTKTFAFMVSLKQARAYQQRLENKEVITFHAEVIAGKHLGNYEILTAVIEGSDPILKNEEIAFTCHLDHPRPGANDNASGCMAILEVARTLKKLIDENKLERPKRSIRFIWSPEIEGTTSLLNYRPNLAKKIKFNIHMDMVGGGPETKAIFHVSRSPQSVSSFINDVGEAFGKFVNINSDAHASGEQVRFPIVSKEGGKEALQAVLGEFSMGSDFQVFSEGSFRIPSIYLHDWPDRYIHTNYDVPANIDPTKLKRSGFIGAASAYYLAGFSDEKLPLLINLLKQQVLKRSSEILEYCESLSTEEAENVKHYFWVHEEERFNSIAPYANLTSDDNTKYSEFLSNLKTTIGKGKKRELNHEKSAVVFGRNTEIKGPMSVFGYDYFTDHFDAEKEKPAIFTYKGNRGSGSEYAYEALNFVDGKRDISEICNLLSAEFGDIPIEYVVEFLEALNSINVTYKLN